MWSNKMLKTMYRVRNIHHISVLFDKNHRTEHLEEEFVFVFFVSQNDRFMPMWNLTYYHDYACFVSLLFCQVVLNLPNLTRLDLSCICK